VVNIMWYNAELEGVVGLSEVFGRSRRLEKTVDLETYSYLTNKPKKLKLFMGYEALERG